MPEEPKGTAIIQSGPVALELSEAAIEVTKQNIKLCEQLVREVLERDIDFGRIPGVPQPFLWDSGAAKIMSAFNCYPDYKVIDATIQVPHIRYTIACYLINRKTQQVVATGIGAAYTKEIKHRYRWVEDPEKEGISPKGLKRNRDGKYRVPNPDTEDLLNTIAKMAAKRADVDATQSLPGVAATLRKLFLGKPTGTQEQRSSKGSPSKTEDQAEKPTWRWFAAKLQTLGVTQAQARDILGVNSIKDDWVGVQKRTIEEAYEIIKGAVSPVPPHEDNVVDKETDEIITPEQWPPLVDSTVLVDQETGEVITPERVQTEHTDIVDGEVSEVPEAKSRIDWPWVKEAIHEMGWHDVGKWLRNRYKNATGKNVVELVEGLSPEQQEEFVHQVQERLDIYRSQHRGR